MKERSGKTYEWMETDVKSLLVPWRSLVYILCCVEAVMLQEEQQQPVLWVNPSDSSGRLSLTALGVFWWAKRTTEWPLCKVHLRSFTNPVQLARQRQIKCWCNRSIHSFWRCTCLHGMWICEKCWILTRIFGL